MKKMLSFIRTHYARLFVSALALLIAFGLGWYAHYARAEAQKAAGLVSPLHITRYALDLIEHLYTEVEDRVSPISPVASLDVVQLRKYAGELHEANTFFPPELRKAYPQAAAYLHDLSYYLLKTDFPNIDAFGPALTAAWPLRDAQVTRSLEESFASIEERLDTEKGQESLAVLEAADSIIQLT